MNTLTQVLTVGAAGFVGSVVRFGVAVAFARLGLNFPLGTLVINVTGSFALGALLGYGAARGAVPEHLRLAIGIGFLGAFTTYSTFAAETDTLLRASEVAKAVAYVALSVVLGVLAARLGYVVAR